MRNLIFLLCFIPFVMQGQDSLSPVVKEKKEVKKKPKKAEKVKQLIYVSRPTNFSNATLKNILRSSKENNFELKIGAETRLISSLSLITFNLSGFVANSIANASYSSWDEVISSGKFTALSKLAATLLVNDSPIRVNTGRPTRRASLVVVWALNGSVSRNKSADWILFR